MILLNSLHESSIFSEIFSIESRNTYNFFFFHGTLTFQNCVYTERAFYMRLRWRYILCVYSREQGVCIIKASISHRTGFCRCQDSLVGSHRDIDERMACSRRLWWEQGRRRWKGKEKIFSSSFSLVFFCHGGKLELYSLFIDPRNLSRFTSTGFYSRSFLHLTSRLTILPATSNLVYKVLLSSCYFRLFDETDLKLLSSVGKVLNRKLPRAWDFSFIIFYPVLVSIFYILTLSHCGS